MKTLIIDDVKQARKALHHDIIDYCEDLQIIGEAGSMAEAISAIEDLKPELIFLDIELGDGTGFDVLSKLSFQPKVIFTTAYDEYAIKAFKVGAIDYLLKPVDDEELVKAVERASEVSVSAMEVVNETRKEEAIKHFTFSKDLGEKEGVEKLDKIQ